MVGARPLARAAFGDRPDLVPAPGRPRDAGDRWLAAVVLGALGRYAAAAALLDGLTADPRTSPVLRAHASVTRAAHLRQLGGHADARRWDARGLAFATGAVEADRVGGRAGGIRDEDDRYGLGPAGARLDALIGLAADAVGLGDAETADRLLHRVERDNVKQISWRSSVRLSWVRAELALSQQRPAEAVPWAGRAVELSRDAGAVRHRLKSELVLVVSESTTGTGCDEAVSRLNALAEGVAGAGLRTLEWVVSLLLADWLADRDPDLADAHRRNGLATLREIRRASDPLGRRVFDRSPWVPDPSGA